MAKKAKSGSGLSRQIAAKRKAIAAINKKKRDAIRHRKQLATLRALDNKLKTARKSVSKRKR